MSRAELKKFKKQEYKKIVLNEMDSLLPDYEKRQYDQTAQCVVNYLQSEVKSLLRKTPAEPLGSTADILSESVLTALDSTMQPAGDDEPDAENETDVHIEIDEIIQTPNRLNDSITKVKEVANAEFVSENNTTKDKTELKKNIPEVRNVAIPVKLNQQQRKF